MTADCQSGGSKHDQRLVWAEILVSEDFYLCTVTTNLIHGRKNVRAAGHRCKGACQQPSTHSVGQDAHSRGRPCERQLLVDRIKQTRTNAGTDIIPDLMTPMNSFLLKHWHRTFTIWGGQPGKCPSSTGVQTQTETCIAPNSSKQLQQLHSGNGTDLNAHKVALVAHSAGPLLLPLCQEASSAHADHMIVVVMLPRPVLEERPDKLGQRLGVLTSEVLHQVHIVHVLALPWTHHPAHGHSIRVLQLTDIQLQQRTKPIKFEVAEPNNVYMQNQKGSRCAQALQRLHISPSKLYIPAPEQPTVRVHALHATKRHSRPLHPQSCTQAYSHVRWVDVS
jgi:hypothetical protein